MAANLPYLASYKNLGLLFEKIASAKTPDAFTHRYLADVLGLKSTADRPFITMLKAMGFLDPGGKPTQEYSKLKNKQVARAAIAEGIGRAYEPLFTANVRANELDTEALKGLVSQVAGADEAMTEKIAYTFSALTKQADFAAPSTPEAESPADEVVAESAGVPGPGRGPKGLRAEFHYNIQIHLPSNASEETYLNIFNAIRKTLA